QPEEAVTEREVAPTSYENQKELSYEGMVEIKGGKFMMGASDDDGRPDEYPPHEVEVDGFWIDQHPVTNKEFSEFVEETGYITLAERKPDWEEMKKQLLPGTPKPHDSLLVPGGLVFAPPENPVPLNDESQWWEWAPGADWKHPQGPDS